MWEVFILKILQLSWFWLGGLFGFCFVLLFVLVLFCTFVLVGFVLFLNGRNVKVPVSEINLIISRDLEFGEQNRKCALNSTGPSSSQQNLGPKKTEQGKIGLD